MALFFSKPDQRVQPTSGSEWADDDLIGTLVGYEHRLRSLRTEIFDSNVINDASWPLLQDLFAAYLDGEKLRTKQVCAMSGLPHTTVLRYLDHLEKFDVIRRENDPDDSRVTLVSITDSGAFWMREYYSQIIKAEQRLRRSDRGLFTLPVKSEGGSSND